MSALSGLKRWETLLLAVFSALGLAVVLSEQFSRPLGLLLSPISSFARGLIWCSSVAAAWASAA